MRHLLNEAIIRTASILPDPTPEQPPGTEGVQTLLNWLSWGVMIVGFGVFLGGAGVLGAAAFSGREAKGVKIIVIGMIVGILASAAGAIMRMFI
ncbi:hypothetical protein [Cellulomonas hominis]|uniref:hypothetical protein n=1 Tax=Cellulomonas hominis TaxID=156981 RepID=UPI001B9CFC70|nr:hypothetical protein [Cellulomonas hominis]VTR76034.1 hypothetical protein CHMI_00790 [Cellulomonas hominis]